MNILESLLSVFKRKTDMLEDSSHTDVVEYKDEIESKDVKTYRRLMDSEMNTSAFLKTQLEVMQRKRPKQDFR